MVVSLLVILCPCHAFTSYEGDNVHADITKEALGTMLSPANLAFVVDANQDQDKRGSEALAEPRRHFGEETFLSSLAYIDREKKRALNYAAEADTDPEARGYALKHIGEMLHSVQDFYSRTNYIELMAQVADYKSRPYDIPLVDWSKVPAGYPGLKCYSPKPGSTNAEELAAFVKDNAQTSGGKQIFAGKVTYFQVARDLAVRETTRQWGLLETMLRNRCGARAAAVIAALKEASPEVKLKVIEDKD